MDGSIFQKYFISIQSIFKMNTAAFISCKSEIYTEADKAMYEAKKNGENRNVFYQEEKPYELTEGLI